jgi:hypothetical protein
MVPITPLVLVLELATALAVEPRDAHKAIVEEAVIESAIMDPSTRAGMT